MLANASRNVVSWNESETLALRAALSVIGTWDTWDTDLDSLLEVESASPTEDANRSPQSKKIAPYRRRKQEISALRAEAQHLQQIIALGRAVIGSISSKNEILQASTSQCEWEQLAHSQRSRRAAAELENAKLRQLLVAQVAYAKRLQNLGHRADCLQEVLTVPTPPPFVNFLSPSVDPVIQLRSLGALVSRATEVFYSRIFKSNEIELFQRSQQLSSRSTEEGVEFESQAMWVVPMDVGRVAEAMWMEMTRPACGNRACVDIYEDENALVSQFMGACKIDIDSGAVEGQVATRILPRDMGDGSVLIVTTTEARSYINSEARGSASFDGYVRIEPVQSLHPGSSGPCSLVKWHHRALLRSPQGPAAKKSEQTKWTQAMVGGTVRSRFEEVLTSSINAIDEVLLTPKPRPSSTTSPNQQ